MTDPVVPVEGNGHRSQRVATVRDDLPASRIDDPCCSLSGVGACRDHRPRGGSQLLQAVLGKGCGLGHVGPRRVVFRCRCHEPCKGKQGYGQNDDGDENFDE